MSNQTKIGLLLGLGVVLLVGIIISDHLATQSQSDITDSAATLADLGERNPTGQSIKSRELFYMPVPAPAPEVAQATPANGAALADSHNNLVPTAIAFNSEPTTPAPLIAGGPDTTHSQALVAVPVAPEITQAVPVPAPAMRTYTVKAGDTLSIIAAATLGSRTRWQEILEANKQTLTSPKSLRVGTVLNIPAAGTTLPMAQAVAPTPARTPVVARTYTVKKGDLLGSIASKELGSSRRVADLVGANKKILAKGDKTVLRIGMVLNIPAQ